MTARFSEIVIAAGGSIAMIFALFVIPAIERSATRKRQNQWVILDHEFIDLMEEDCNG